MKSELSKSRPNEVVVGERMQRTLAHRRRLIESSTVDVVLDSYPALKLGSQVRIVTINTLAECDHNAMLSLSVPHRGEIQVVG